MSRVLIPSIFEEGVEKKKKEKKKSLTPRCRENRGNRGQGKRRGKLEHWNHVASCEKRGERGKKKRKKVNRERGGRGVARMRGATCGGGTEENPFEKFCIALRNRGGTTIEFSTNKNE